MKNYHEIPLHSSNNEQVLASKYCMPCQRAGKYTLHWAAGVSRCCFAIADPLCAGLQDTSPNPATSPRTCSSASPEMRAPKLTPIHDGDFTLSRRVLIHAEQRLERALGVCWLSSPNWARQKDAGLCSLCTTPSLDSLLSPSSPLVSRGDGSFSWESAVGVGMLVSGTNR